MEKANHQNKVTESLSYSLYYMYLDIDECFTGSHMCANGATCVNTQGSYTCTCATGWTDDTCQIGEFRADCLQTLSFFLLHFSRKPFCINL